MANYKYRKYGTRVNKNYRENNGEKASKKLDMRREDLKLYKHYISGKNIV